MAMGDDAAKDILQRAAHFLAEDISTAARHISADGTIPVVLCGSLWEASDGFLRKTVQSMLGERYVMKMMTRDPAWGAARAALLRL